MAKSFKKITEEFDYDEWGDDDFEVSRKQRRLESRRQERRQKRGEKMNFDGDE